VSVRIDPLLGSPFEFCGNCRLPNALLEYDGHGRRHRVLQRCDDGGVHGLNYKALWLPIHFPDFRQMPPPHGIRDNPQPAQ
jgi:hypothetical protein